MSSPPLFSPYKMITLYRGLVRPCMEYASHVWGGSIHTALLNRVEAKAFRLINFPPLTVFNLSNTVAMLHLYLSSTAIFMVTAPLNLLTACFLPSCALTTQNFLLPLLPILSTSLMQEITSIFILYSLLLVTSGTLLYSVFPLTYNLNSFKSSVSRHLHTKLTFYFNSIKLLEARQR